jgi:hypothetical protein
MKDINEIIITFFFFQNYPVFKIKSLDFDSRCQVAKIMNKGHLIPEVLEKIMEIKANMNNNRIIDATIDMDSEVGDETEGFYFCK